LRKNKIAGCMWVEGEPVLLIWTVIGHIYNDDGSIWDIYDVKKQVFYHGSSVGVVSPSTLCGMQISMLS
jgi:hypothetical protein